jgi:hypothetical protein
MFYVYALASAAQEGKRSVVFNGNTAMIISRVPAGFFHRTSYGRGLPNRAKTIGKN